MRDPSEFANEKIEDKLDSMFIFMFPKFEDIYALVIKLTCNKEAKRISKYIHSYIRVSTCFCSNRTCRREMKAQTCLRICAASTEPSLLQNTKYGCTCG